LKPTTLVQQLSRHEQLNFLLTNRIPRRWATLFMGWFSRIRHPLVRRVSMYIWQLFSGDLRLHEARESHFASMHECFIRQLRPDARPVDPAPEVLISPCDGIVGACGPIHGTQVFQAKGYPYSLEELLGDKALARRYQNGAFVTIRIKASMYHRFHAPETCHLNEVRYISGDTWNVNPIALKRVEKLFCRNERAVLELDLTNDGADAPPVRLLLVAVAAILVASIRLHALPTPLNLRYRGPNRLPCDASYQRGEEMGYFEHGSTILAFAPPELRLHPDLKEGQEIWMGRPLFSRNM
jgi:phosphatidylserine decarboxylase